MSQRNTHAEHKAGETIDLRPFFFCITLTEVAYFSFSFLFIYFLFKKGMRCFWQRSQ